MTKSLAEALGTTDPRPLDAQAADDLFELQEFTTAKEFCRAFIESKEYRASLMRRIVTDSLPPAVERFFLETAMGKPVERHAGADGGPLNVITRVVRVVVDSDGRELRHFDAISKTTH